MRKSRRSANFTVGLTILVMILPGGAMISVPMIAEGITGIPDKNPW